MKKPISKDVFKNARKCHKIWHQFQNYIVKQYGKDLYGELEYLIPGNKKTKYRSFDEVKFSQRLVGHEVMCKIEKYVKRYLPEIKIIYCDDDSYSSSIILLVPHPKHGITILFIPQCTGVQNRMFLYKHHYKQLVKGLKKMKNVY